CVSNGTKPPDFVGPEVGICIRGKMAFGIVGKHYRWPRLLFSHRKVGRDERAYAPIKKPGRQTVVLSYCQPVPVVLRHAMDELDGSALPTLKHTDVVCRGDR